MGNFTERKKHLKELFGQGKFKDTAELCKQYISELDHEDFDMFEQLSSYYKIMYDCYFRLSDEASCKEVLKHWIIYAGYSDDEIYKVHFANVILGIVTGRGNEKLELLDQCIGRYSKLNQIKTVADLLTWKGIATKDIKYLRNAVKLYDECIEDTKADKKFALSKIKELRHLS